MLRASRAQGNLSTLRVDFQNDGDTLTLSGSREDVQMAHDILTSKAPAPPQPACVTDDGTGCVASYVVGSAWVMHSDKLLKTYKATALDKNFSSVPDKKSGTILLVGDKQGVADAWKFLDQLHKTLPAAEPDTPLQLCAINNVAPAASVSVVNAVIGFLNGGNIVPTPPPTPAPSPSGSPSPVPTPVPTPAFNAKNGSVILDSQQQRIIVHIPGDSVPPLRQVLAAFTNVSPTVYRYYEVRYSIPDPIPAPSAALVSGELSSAPSMTAPQSSVSTLATTVGAVMNALQTGVTLQPDSTYPRILVAGPSSGVNEALRLLDELDKRPAQIQLTLNVLEYDTVKARNLGVQIPQTTVISGSIGPYIAPTVAGPATPAPVFHGKIDSLTGPTVPFDFNTLMNDGILKLQSSPQVQTLNGRQAVIDVGQVIPFTANTINAQGVIVPGIVNYTIGTHLEITPFINNDGSISIYVHPINSTLTGFTVQNAPQIDRRELSANFRLKPGEAVFLTGLTEDDTTDIRDQIPGLALIPWLGKHLFGNRNSTDNYTKLSIELTATIEDPGELSYSAPTVQVTTAPLPTPSPIPPQALAMNCIPLPTPTPKANTAANPVAGGQGTGDTGAGSGSPLVPAEIPFSQPENGLPSGSTGNGQPIPVPVATPLPISAPPTPFATPPVGPGPH